MKLANKESMHAGTKVVSGMVPYYQKDEMGDLSSQNVVYYQTVSPVDVMIPSNSLSKSIH